MANSYGETSWTIDTAGEILALGNHIKLTKLEWHPNAVDNDLQVIDGNSEPIWEVRAKIAAGANHDSIGILQKDFHGQEFDGFDVETLDGGTLYVYFK